MSRIHFINCQSLLNIFATKCVIYRYIAFGRLFSLLFRWAKQKTVYQIMNDENER